ncbi:hypothetical protein RPHASCH2410_CH17775 [Rhizobium phaseoli Ch24-10]|nr:hypothetical protein RPHASCH2410_CH17775 [Rhizobium phaseoli Ch24-10]
MAPKRSISAIMGLEISRFSRYPCRSSIASREGRHEYLAHCALSRRDADQGDMAPLVRISS